MNSDGFDLIVIGGGMGGAALGKVMAEHGVRVLILEREATFQDRVRGEAMSPWGVPEARALGIEKLLLDTCGHELPWVESYLGGNQIERRDLRNTTKHGTVELAFYHPAMQEILLQAAADAGCTVLRGATAQKVHGGARPSVVVHAQGQALTFHARLVVGADGRMSSVRKLANFTIERDPEERLLAGVLLEGMAIRHDTSYGVFDTRQGRLVALFPQGNHRVRAYFSYPSQSRSRLQGAAALPELIQESIRSGAPAQWYEHVTAAGPLASFASDDHWVPHPYKEGVVLVGDAAAANDPMYGQGMSLTLRDVRVLTSELRKTDDWDAACHQYASQHDAYFAVLHTFSHWFETLFYQTGPAGDSIRARAFRQLALDRSRMPDYFFSGPDGPITEDVRRRMFGED